MNEWKKTHLHLIDSNNTLSSSVTKATDFPTLILFCSHSHVSGDTQPSDDQTPTQLLETDKLLKKSMPLIFNQPQWNSQRKFIYSLLNAGLLHLIHQQVVFSNLFEQLRIEYNISCSRKQNQQYLQCLIQVINECSNTHVHNLPESHQLINTKSSSKPTTETILQSLETTHSGILIVEDNLINQKVLISMLKRLGYKSESISIANNGQQAVEMAQYISGTKKKFDVILMDIQMPVMNGIEAATQIRKSYIGSSPIAPIMIAITANILPSDKELYLSSGFVDYLPKPYSMHDLKILLEKWKV